MHFSNSKNSRKFTYPWKLDNSLFNNNLVWKEAKKEFIDYIEFNEDDDTAYPNLQDTMKAVQRRKFIALRALFKKLERSYTNILAANIKALEEKEANTPKRRRQEIVKLRAEIKHIITKSQQNKTDVSFVFYFEKINKKDIHKLN